MKLKLHWQIMIAIVLGAMAGWFSGEEGRFLGIHFLSIYDFFGTLFLNALKMLIVPLIASSIIVGVAGIGSSGNLGRLGGKTLGFYVITTLAAILVGLVLVNAVRPGELGGEAVGDLLALTTDGADVAAQVADASSADDETTGSSATTDDAGAPPPAPANDVTNPIPYAGNLSDAILWI